MKTKLTQDQIDQLDNLISYTILPALYEDGICEPDMSDVAVDSEGYEDCHADRQLTLILEAITYIKNNLH